MAETPPPTPNFDLRRVHDVELVGLTPEAQAALDGATRRAVHEIPFRVGRENRRGLAKLTMSFERRLGKAPQLNHLYIKENGDQFHVSRTHFLINVSHDGFFLLDRGSVCGTLVNGVAVGGNRKGGRVAITSGDRITVGSKASPFVFQFVYRQDHDSTGTS